MLFSIFNGKHYFIHFFGKGFICNAGISVLLVNTSRNMHTYGGLEHGTRYISAKTDCYVRLKILNYFLAGAV